MLSFRTAVSGEAQTRRMRETDGAPRECVQKPAHEARGPTEITRGNGLTDQDIPSTSQGSPPRSTFRKTGRFTMFTECSAWPANFAIIICVYLSTLHFPSSLSATAYQKYPLAATLMVFSNKSATPVLRPGEHKTKFEKYFS